MARNCIAKRLYAAATPYVQIMGWVAIAVPVVYSASTWVNNTTAYGDDIKDLKAYKQSTAEAIARMDYNIQIIGRKIGVKPLEPNK